MGPIRGIKYRGHEIRLIAWSIPDQEDFSAMYEIRPTIEADLAKRGKVPGTLATLEQAELAALKSAIRWIDQQNTL